MPKDPSLYEVWQARQRGNTFATAPVLLRDHVTGAPVHPRSVSLREQEKTALPLSGADVAAMVPPDQVSLHSWVWVWVCGCVWVWV